MILKNVREEKEEVTFPLCSFMCFMSIKLTLNGSCKVMAKVAHFVFNHLSLKRTITFTPDHGLIPFKNLLTHRKIMFLATRVLLLCFVYCFVIKKRNCIVFSDTTCIQK